MKKVLPIIFILFLGINVFASKTIQKTKKYKNTNIEIKNALHTVDYFSYNEDAQEFHIRIIHKDSEGVEYDETILRLKYEDLDQDFKTVIDLVYGEAIDYVKTLSDYENAIDI